MLANFHNIDSGIQCTELPCDQAFFVSLQCINFYFLSLILSEFISKNNQFIAL